MPFLTKNTTRAGAYGGERMESGGGFDNENTSSQALKLNLCEPSRDVRFKDRLYLGGFICTVLVMLLMAVTIRFFLPPYKRLEETDSWGNRCGVDNRGGGDVVDGKYARDMRAQTRTFFTAKTETFRFLRHDIFNQYFVRLCVKECPRLAVKCDDFLRYNGYDGYIDDTKVLDTRACIGHLDLILPQNTQTIPNLICTPKVISLDSPYSKTPKDDDQAMDSLSNSVLSSTDTVFYHKQLVGIFILMATVISYLFAFMLFFIPRFSPYYFALFSIHICLLSAIVCFYKINEINSVVTPVARDDSIAHLVDHIYYRDIDNYVVGNETWLKEAEHMNVSELEDISDVIGSYGGRKQQQAYIIAAAVIIAFCVLMMLPEIFTLQEYYIDCATLMFQVLTSFHKYIPLVFTIPLITGTANFILYWYFTLVVYQLFISHTSDRDSDGVEIVNHTTPAYMYLLRTITVLCILWVAEFCRGCEQFIIAGCVMDCYFDPTRGAHSRKRLAIVPQLTKLFGRSMGQIAFGSLIVIVCAPVRTFLYVFHIFFSVETCNWHGLFQLRKAYLSVVLFGDGYKSAWNRTRALLNQHASYALETNYIMNFYVILVRISVTVMTTIGFIMITGTRWYAESEEVGVPVFEIGFGAWFVSKSVLNVQHVSSNAMIYCFCVDMERNNGRELPYSSPKYMIKAMENLKAKVAEHQLKRVERRKTIWGRLNFKTWRNAENEDTVSNFTYHEGTSLADRDSIPEL